MLGDYLQLPALSDLEHQDSSTSALRRVIIKVRCADDKSLSKTTCAIVKFASHAALDQLVLVQGESMQFLENDFVNQFEMRLDFFDASLQCSLDGAEAKGLQTRAVRDSTNGLVNG